MYKLSPRVQHLEVIFLGQICLDKCPATSVHLLLKVEGLPTSTLPFLYAAPDLQDLKLKEVPVGQSVCLVQRQLQEVSSQRLFLLC